MCGFGGLIDLTGRALPDTGQADRAGGLLRHRGPDEAAVWRGDGAVIAHTRLSIIDLGGSRQPMLDQAQRVLAYNGEAFNYRQLRDTLPGPWVSRGDTEVMMRLVTTRGVEGLADVRGQFALSLWDPRRRTLTLARDAMGILPLFWWSDGDRVAFASEPDALRSIVPETLTVDPDSLALYLLHRAVPAPGTMWSGLHKLRPGHAITFEAGRPPRIVDWRPPAPTNDPRMGFDTAVSGTSAALRVAVERALEADVPVGAYLSGGLDSSLICATVRSCRPDQKLRTYCAVFEDTVEDEGHWAGRVAEHLGTIHQSVKVRATDFLAEWPQLSRFRGAPVSEPADIALHRLAVCAREDVKVVLSGEGADEVFAGYPKHRMADVTAAVGVFPAWARRTVLASTAEALPPRTRRLAVALTALAEPTEPERLRAWFASFTPADIERLTGRRLPPPETPDAGTPLGRMLRYDQTVWLSDNLLERGDRMNMAASLELRPPYLDADLVNFAGTIPPKLLVSRGTTKRILKAVAAPLLPESVVNRRKAGFPVPMGTWLRGSLGASASDLLLATDAFIAPYVDQKVAAALLDEHRHGRADRTAKIWTLLSLEIWGRHIARGTPWV